MFYENWSTSPNIFTTICTYTSFSLVKGYVLASQFGKYEGICPRTAMFCDTSPHFSMHPHNQQTNAPYPYAGSRIRMPHRVSIRIRNTEYGVSIRPYRWNQFAGNGFVCRQRIRPPNRLPFVRFAGSVCHSVCR